MKYTKRILTLLFILAIILQIFSIETFALNDSQTNINKGGVSLLSNNEIQELNNIDGSLYQNLDIIQLKKLGRLNDFIKFLQNQYNTQKEQELSDRVQELTKWGLSPQKTTVSDLEKIVQGYLDLHYNGIKIGSTEFNNMVKTYLYDDSFGVAKKAKDEPEFGPLYVYMCIYDDNTTSTNDNSSFKISDKTSNKTLFQICENIFENDFKNTQSKLILKNYLINNNIKSSNSAWPLINGGRVQVYARNYANSYNPAYVVLNKDDDCTNFVSQALYYGGLPQTSYVGEEKSNGLVETSTRWFNFNNNTSSGYSISTSWIRVVDLYNYLAPHYSTFETTDGNTMNQNLRTGYILQGKHAYKLNYSHSVVVTTAPKTLMYCAHSTARLDAPISKFYDGFSKYRVIKIW